MAYSNSVIWRQSKKDDVCIDEKFREITRNSTVSEARMYHVPTLKPVEGDRLVQFLGIKIGVLWKDPHKGPITFRNAPSPNQIHREDRMEIDPLTSLSTLPPYSYQVPLWPDATRSQRVWEPFDTADSWVSRTQTQSRYHALSPSGEGDHWVPSSAPTSSTASWIWRTWRP